jgi:metallophosphoesterase superfamily enzyme
MKMQDLYKLGYAHPVYTIRHDWCYQYKDATFHSKHEPSVVLPGLDFKVARLEDAKAEEVAP